MKTLKDNVVTTFLAVSFFTLTAFFFSAMNVHYINIAEFDFTAKQVAIYLIIFCIVLTVLITKFVTFFKHKTVEKIVVLFLALGVLVWIQANLVPWDYGVLDGKEIDWEHKKIYGYLDGGMWILGLLICFFKSKVFYKNARTISVAFILVQVIFLTITVSNAPAEPSLKSYTISEDQKYTFSKDNNVVFVILDTFQTDVFQEIIKDDPSFKDVFDGFTYYRNALSGFPTTYPSVPFVLTGQYYENKIPMQDFIKEVFLGNSLPKVLKDSGYEVDLFASRNTVLYDERIASNFVKKTDIFINSGEFLRFLTADIFKISPHFAKKLIYNHLTKKQAEKTAIDQFFEFMDGIKKKAEVANSADQNYDKGSFKYYHLIGIHPPLTIDENFQIKELEMTRENLKKQGIAMLKSMELLLEKLKKLGVYDNSMVIIIADHGLGTDINLNLYKRLKDSNKVPMKEKGTALPLVLVKPFKATGEMKMSDSPVSLMDVPITVFKALGITGDFVGRSMLDVSENENRTRRFLYYDWANQYWKLEKRYLPPMKEYFVTGFSWLDSSWTAGKVINPVTITN
ncbi:MAG: sulfatase-like hydrolase/transferase [Candidatus Gracilibacteria bacterium]